MINFNHWLCYMMWPYHTADVSLSVHLWQTIIIVIHRFNADIDAYRCMLHQPQRLGYMYAYPATVDIALTMIHIDIYVRVANVIIIFIIDNTYNC